MPFKSIKHLGNLTIKNSKAGLPKNVCIKLKKGSGKVLMQNFFDPTTAFDVEVSSLLMGGHLIPKRKSPVQKLKNAKFVNYCLFAKNKKR